MRSDKDARTRGRAARRPALPGGRQWSAAGLPRRLGPRAPQPAAGPGAGHDAADDPAVGRRRLRGVLRQPLAGDGPGDHLLRRRRTARRRDHGAVRWAGAGDRAQHRRLADAAAARRPAGRGHPGGGRERGVHARPGRQAGAARADAGGRADRSLLRRGHRRPACRRTSAGPRCAGWSVRSLDLAARRIRIADPVDAVTMLRAEDEFDVRDRLSQIPTETLVAYGSRDYLWPLEMVAETAARMPRARLILYADRGHALPLAREFVRDVIGFLRAGDAPRSLCRWRCSSRSTSVDPGRTRTSHRSERTGIDKVPASRPGRGPRPWAQARRAGQRPGRRLHRRRQAPRRPRPGGVRVPA